jgi:acetate kinase
VKVLVLNTGSSSLKFALLDAEKETALLEGLADWATPPGVLRVEQPGPLVRKHDLPAGGPEAAVGHVLNWLTHGADAPLARPEDVAAVGHRVVHGGAVFTSSVRVDDGVKRALAELGELAPLHNPVNLAGIVAAQAAWPKVPHVAVFDTSFHATIPAEARTYALPQAWTERGLVRYGFHGLSCAYCARRAAEMLGRGGPRLVICHLGQGCSATAVRDGKSVDTSMGFTPLDGLVMGSRSGSVDPGLLLHVLRQDGPSADDLDRVLNRESGLLGVSGLSADMRTVLAEAAKGHEGARLARDVFVHRLRKTIGGLAAALGGVEALVFTAGIGEHSAEVRALTCRGLEHLGLEIDAAANETCKPDADVATAASRARILVIATREDLTIVRETVRVLHAG